MRSNGEASIRLLAIVGPTACGKTRLGVEIAHRLGSEILSADSRQTYRGLDLGTGKDLEEYSRVSPPVTYHMIDVADPRKVYSLFEYQQDCYRLFESAAARVPFADGVPLLLVGGSGLYAEAVLRGYRIPNVPEDVELRNALMQRGHAELVTELRALGHDIELRTDMGSKKRVVRAIEIARYAPSHPLRYSAPPPLAIDFKVFGVDVPLDQLRDRIEARLASRFERGLIAEVEQLIADGVTPARMAQLGLEYREVTAFLAGAKDRKAMVADLCRGIRRLAKRQKTWFRGLERRGVAVEWIGPDDRDRVLRDPWVTRTGYET